MTCNDKCIHFPVCEEKKYDFANIDECQYYEEKRPHGEWIDRSDDGRIRYPFWERYECSKCGSKSENTNFCPNCGADMRKEGDNK